MKTVDLTQTISNTTPVYPDTEPLKLTICNTYEKNGFKETYLELSSHTGTHVDAPHHLYAEGIALDQMKVESFIGKGLVIDATDIKAGQEIPISYITRCKEKADEADFLLFHTGWAKYWGVEEYFGEYPVISKEIVEYIVATKKKGIGFDTIGLDSISNTELTLHHKILSTNATVIIENLCNLEQLGHEIFTFVGLPLKFENSDGAPIRVIGMI